METSLLESFFNNVEDLKALNFIKKRPRHRYFPVNFLQFFKKTLAEHLWMTALADSSVPSKVYYWSHFVRFFLHFFLLLLIIDNCNYESLLRKFIKMKIFLHFATFFYFLHKCCKGSFASAIICQCTLKKMQISIGNCQVSRQILKAVNYYVLGPAFMHINASIFSSFNLLS